MTRRDDTQDPDRTQRIPGLAKAIAAMENAPKITAPTTNKAERRRRIRRAAGIKDNP